MYSGKGPVILFPLKLISTIVEIVLKLSGMVPEIALPDKSITLRSAKSPMFLGIVPTKLFCARRICVVILWFV